MNDSMSNTIDFAGCTVSQLRNQTRDRVPMIVKRRLKFVAVEKDFGVRGAQSLDPKFVQTPAGFRMNDSGFD